ncbi:MAG: hypothetical protein WCJ29_02995 [bacterium]
MGVKDNSKAEKLGLIIFVILSFPLLLVGVILSFFRNFYLENIKHQKLSLKISDETAKRLKTLPEGTKIIINDEEFVSGAVNIMDEPEVPNYPPIWDIRLDKERYLTLRDNVIRFAGCKKGLFGSSCKAQPIQSLKIL